MTLNSYDEDGSASVAREYTGSGRIRYVVPRPVDNGGNLEALPFADRCIEELRAYMEQHGLLHQDAAETEMDVEQAKQRLLALLDASRDSLKAADVEADDELARDHATVSAAAHMLATEPGIITGEETDGREWFPYSFMMRS